MKALIILLLAIVIFGTGGYYTYELFYKPQQALQDEKQLPPPPPPPDPTIPEFNKRVELQKSGNLVEARNAWTDFIDRYPESTRIEEAKNRLGQLNVAIFLSPIAAPEKQVYTVQKGDVINRVAAKLKVTPELIFQANRLDGIMLRIGQRLMVGPSDFSLIIDRHRKKVVLLNGGKFFKQYPILEMPTPHGAKKGAGPTPRPPKITGKVTERIAWSQGQRVTPFDKDKGAAFKNADHWIMIAPSGHSLYTEPQPTNANANANESSQKPPESPQKPPGGGYALAPEDMRELAVILSKNDPVTIE